MSARARFKSQLRAALGDSPRQKFVIELGQRLPEVEADRLSEFAHAHPNRLFSFSTKVLLLRLDVLAQLASRAPRSARLACDVRLRRHLERDLDQLVAAAGAQAMLDALAPHAEHVPGCVEGGTRSLILPSSVGTSISPPSAACTKVIGTLHTTSSPSV